MKPVHQKEAGILSGIVAICGNPNSGKTTIFNAMTGLNQKVGNYPGVTVEKVSGTFRSPDDESRKLTLVDVPGAYSLSAFSPDEYIAASALFGDIQSDSGPDALICVVDATSLERGLYFLLQILQIGKPIVVALNMVDLIKRRGLQIDFDGLSAALGGIPVVPIVGNKGTGTAELKRQVARLTIDGQAPSFSLRFDDVTEQALVSLKNNDGAYTRSRAERLRILLDVGGPAEKHFVATASADQVSQLEHDRGQIRHQVGSLTMAETSVLTDKAHEVFSKTVRRGERAAFTFSERIDNILLNPVLGPLVLLLIMATVFQSIFSLAAPLMEAIDSGMGLLSGWLAGVVPPGPLQSLLTDGVVGGVGAVLAFVPQIAILFLFISILEDSGYMTRAAFLVDRMFRWCGLSGRSFIPMLSSFACAVPGIMATRTIDDRKLRYITILVAPLMTCSARLPVYAIMISAFIPYQSYGVFNLQGLVLTGLYLLGIVMAVLVSFVLKKLVYRTERDTFIMEMPSYKIPAMRSVSVRVSNRLKSFLTRAGTIIMAITIVVWALGYYPRSQAVTDEFAAMEERMASDHLALIAELDGTTQVLISTLTDEDTRTWSELVADFDSADNISTLQTLRDEIARGHTLSQELIQITYEHRMAEFQLSSDRGKLANRLAGVRIRGSYFAQIGQAVEPLFVPLGWDWKITMAVLSSFPAREVIIAVLGTIYNLGTDAVDQESSLIEKMRQSRWEDGPRKGEKVFSPVVAVSVMIFFALCCQCGATVVTIKQETNSWMFALSAFTYMTVLAYVVAFFVYQLFSGIGS